MHGEREKETWDSDGVSIPAFTCLHCFSGRSVTHGVECEWLQTSKRWLPSLVHDINFFSSLFELSLHNGIIVTLVLLHLLHNLVLRLIIPLQTARC